VEEGRPVVRRRADLTPPFLFLVEVKERERVFRAQLGVDTLDSLRRLAICFPAKPSVKEAHNPATKVTYSF